VNLVDVLECRLDHVLPRLGVSRRDERFRRDETRPAHRHRDRILCHQAMMPAISRRVILQLRGGASWAAEQSEPRSLTTWTFSL